MYKIFFKHIIIQLLNINFKFLFTFPTKRKGFFVRRQKVFPRENFP